MSRAFNNGVIVGAIAVILVVLAGWLLFFSPEQAAAPVDAPEVVGADENESAEGEGQTAAENAGDQSGGQTMLQNIDWNQVDQYEELVAAKIDVDYDGDEDLFVIYEGGAYCGATGCRFEIIENQGDNWQRVYPESDVPTDGRIHRFRVSMNQVEGFRDVSVTVSEPEAEERQEVTLRFDGRWYREVLDSE